MKSQVAARKFTFCAFFVLCFIVFNTFKRFTTQNLFCLVVNLPSLCGKSQPRYRFCSDANSFLDLCLAQRDAKHEAQNELQNEAQNEVQNDLEMEEQSKAQNEDQPLLKKIETKSVRRADMDILRVIVTWIVLCFHTVLIYTPHAKYHLEKKRTHSPWECFSIE